MELTGAMQELLVGLLLYGDNKDAGIIRVLVPPDVFDTHYKRLAKAALAYHDRYQQAPGEHSHEVIASIIASSDSDKKLYQRILASIDASKDNINRKYVLESAAAFEHFQRIRTKVADVLDILEVDPTPEGVLRASGLLAEAAKPNQSVGVSDINMMNPIHLIRLFVEDDDEVLVMGIPAYDRWRAGPERGGLHMLIAPPSSGKSWWCIYLGKMALRQSWRVVHITVEISAQNTGRRYLQAIHGWTKRRVGRVERSRLIKDEKGLVIDVDSQWVQRQALDSLTRRARKRMLSMAPHTRLRIKGFPSGSLTIEQLEAYLDVLEMTEGFVPDLLIVDYVDEMCVTSHGKRRYEAIGDLYTALRGVAGKRNLAAVTVSQASKEAEHRRWVTRDNAAEAFSKIAKADVGFTFSRTVAEERLGLGRLNLIRARNDGGVHTRVVISQSYDTGQFITDSALMEDEGYWGIMDSYGGSASGDD